MYNKVLPVYRTGRKYDMKPVRGKADTGRDLLEIYMTVRNEVSVTDAFMESI